MRILLLSMLFPNSVQPHKGQFVRERMRQVQQRYDMTWQVVAPVPWFPFTHARFGSYGKFAIIPASEFFEGDHVLHPRYPAIPKVGDFSSPLGYAASVARTIARHDIECDVIDAHFFFPDGVAAVLLGHRLRKQVVITARGSDINLMPNEIAAGRWIRWAARRSDRLVAVSEPLAEKLRLLSDGKPVMTAPNGVDTGRFRPSPSRAKIRKKRNIQGIMLLSVGNLIELKGHHLVIEAVRELPEVTLLIAGDGPWRRRLEQMVATQALQQRVRFLGAVPQDELIACYSAADALVLASSSEGSPNAVLESLSCGTPVITSIEDAIPTGPSMQDITHAERSASAIRAAIQGLINRKIDHDAVRQRARSLDWESTCSSLNDLYRSLHAARCGATG